MKRCSDSLVIRTQIKTTLKCHFTLRMAIRMAIIQNKQAGKQTKHQEVLLRMCKNWNTHALLIGMQNDTAPVEQFDGFAESLNIGLPYNLTTKIKYQSQPVHRVLFYLVGVFRTQSLGVNISVALRKLLQRGERWTQATYKFVKKEAGSLNIKDYCEVRKTRYQVKEFSILCMGRCKTLGKPNAFLSYAPQFSRTKSCSLVHLSECQMWQMAASCISTPAPQQSLWRVVVLPSGSQALRSILGAFIHIWRPEIVDGYDISCLLI